MPQYWLKPFGTTDPPRTVPPLWTSGADLDSFEILSGPATPRKPPQMGAGDLVLFHAVGHVRMYAAGEILNTPRHDPNHNVWADRFPWVYRVRVDVWVPDLLDAPRTTDVAPPRIIGRLQAGAPYAKLTPGQYDDLLAELKKTPGVMVRAPREG